jgi:hypothetical protein
VNGDQLERNSLFKAGKFSKLSIDGNVNYITKKSSQTSTDLLDDLIQTPGNVDLNLFKTQETKGIIIFISKSILDY